MKRIFFLLSFLILFLPSSLFAKDKGASDEELYSLANLALADERFDEAIAGYSKIEDMGIENPDVYYNMGNAYAKSDQLGMAVYYYEKSAKLLSKKDALHNLAFVRQRLSLASQSVDARSPLERMTSFLTLKESSDWALALYVATFVFLSIRLRGRKEGTRKIAGRLALFSCILFLFSGMTATYKFYLQSQSSYAIVLSGTAPLYEVPMENIEATNDVPEGVKLTLLEEEDGWYKVTSPGGLAGWVRAGKVGVI
jgi:tetratricopeptide (TPR) repeat protein